MKPWEQTKAAARIYAPDALWADEIERRVLASCHPYQRAFVQDDGRRVSALVGRGGGKTTGARARCVIKMARIAKAKLVYVATTREHARELMWDPLKDLTERLGIEATFNETRMTCTFKRNGARLRLFGADDMREIDKLRGQSFHEVQIDEAASHSDKILDALIKRIVGPRLGDYNGCIVLFGTPGHILSGLFYDATRLGSDNHRPFSDRENPDYAGWKQWSSHAWDLEMAGRTIPAIGRQWDEALEEKAANGWSDDHPIWLREYKGQWAADDTEHVYKYRADRNQWDPPRVGPMRFAKLPDDRADWLYVNAMDMGHADPFACNVFAFSPSDPEKRIYHVFGFEKKGMYARQIAELLLGEAANAENPQGVYGQAGWPVGAVIDSDDAIIQELANVYGIRVVKSDRKAGLKFGAIELVNGDLIDGRIFILKGSALELQLTQLQWVANEFGELKENKGQANHSSDCLAYGRRLIAHLFETGEAQATKPAQIARRAGLQDPIDPIENPGGEFAGLLDDGSYGDMWG